MKADQVEEPLPTPPGADQIPGEENKPPDPNLELEDAEGDLPDPDDPVTKDQPEFPTPELPAPPIVQTPIAAGLDRDQKE
jgi:hypothetical protein